MVLYNMNLWSFHPKYLDEKGLRAVWQDALFAQNVLSGRIKDHRKYYPQLMKFNNYFEPLAAIGAYLGFIYDDGVERGIIFQEHKIMHRSKRENIFQVDRERLEDEFEQYKRKMQTVSMLQTAKLRQVSKVEPHPIFEVV